MGADAIPADFIRSPRLVLRCWRPSDAARFKGALDASLRELQRWIPWTLEEPSPLSVIEARLGGYREDFYAGKNALYALMDPAENLVLGGVGLYRRRGPGVLELGYWIRSDQAGQGLGTEAVALLTDQAFRLADIERAEIHCDPGNLASVNIPRKLGFRHRETLIGNAPWPTGEARDTMIWDLTASVWRARNGASPGI